MAIEKDVVYFVSGPLNGTIRQIELDITELIVQQYAGNKHSLWTSSMFVNDPEQVQGVYERIGNLMVWEGWIYPPKD